MSAYSPCYIIALQALISSLAPDGSTDKKLSDEQVEALSDRLNQFLGDGGEGPEVRRNEKGEVRCLKCHESCIYLRKHT